ncbi:MAG: AAA-like domain-containing protein [Fimbriimonadaceae bacterium]|nr:AAA-like domain-containing protein [Fimbriimonadaceae bacterium]
MDESLRFFRAGGALDPNARCYIRRRADDHLLLALLSGEYMYVLDSRQKGKSSLVARTIVQLRDKGAHAVTLDLQRLGSNLTLEQWYAGLLLAIADKLGLRALALCFWREHPEIGPVARFSDAISQVLLAHSTGPIVVFIDEVDFVRGLPFSADEFFGVIRECHNRRATDRDFRRLTFCLSGVATPGQLIQNPTISPFNIGTRVDLTDFELNDTMAYAAVLNPDRKKGIRLIKRIYWWVSGHPYLTQLICNRMITDSALESPADVDRIVTKMFLSPEARQREPNLADVERRVLEADIAGRSADERRSQVLELYGRILKSGSLKAPEPNPIVTALRLSGIAVESNGILHIRNRLYQNVFDEAWRRQNLPDAESRRIRTASRRAFLRAASLGSVLVGILSVVAFMFWKLSDDRAAALAKLKQKNIEAARQSYIGRMASIGLAIKSDKWMRVVEQVEKTRHDPFRGWEWGHLAMLIDAGEPIAKLPPLSTLSVDPDGRVVARCRNEVYDLSGPTPILLRRDGLTGWNLKVEGNLALASAGIERDTGNTIQVVDSGRILQQAPTDQRFLSIDTRRRNLLKSASKLEFTGPQAGASTVVLANLDTLQEFSSVSLPARPLDAQFLTDGSFLVMGSGYVFRVSETGKILARADIPQQTDSGTLTLSKDREMFIAYGFNEEPGIVRRSSDCRVVTRLPGKAALVDAATFSPDGSRLALACGDGLVTVYSLPTGQRERVFPAFVSPAQSLEFSHDGQVLYGLDREGQCRRWRMDAERATEAYRDHSLPVVLAMTSSDGSRIASVDQGGTIVVREPRTGDVVRRRFDSTHHPIFALRGWVGGFGTGDRLFVDTKDGELLRLNRSTLKPERALRIFEKGPVRLRPITGVRRIIVYQIVPGVEVSRIALVDDDSMTVLRRFEAHRTTTPMTVFGPGGNWLAIRTAPRRIIVVSTADGATVGEFDAPADVIGMAVAPNGKTLALSMADSEEGSGPWMGRFDAQSGQLIHRFAKLPNEVYWLRFSPDGKTLAMIAADGTAALLRNSAELVGIRGANHFNVTFSPDSERAIAMATNESRLLDVATGDEVFDLSNADLGRPQRYASELREFSADGRSILMAGNDGSVRIWRSTPWTEQASRPTHRY